MNVKRSTFFWLTTSTILLLSLTLFMLSQSFTNNSSIITSLIVHPAFEKLESFARVAEKISSNNNYYFILENLIFKRYGHHHRRPKSSCNYNLWKYDLTQLIFKRHGHHHRRPKSSCNYNLWKYDLTQLYNITLHITVDLKGCMNFSSVQRAVNALLDFSSTRSRIIIDRGTYREKVEISSNKTNLVIQGQGYLNTFMSWNDIANPTGGTAYSFTVAIFAPKFLAYNISFLVKYCFCREVFGSLIPLV